MARARGIILVPTNRAARAISEAFVRRAETGLLLPRLVPLGDLDLDEKLGSALDPIGEDVDIPPAIAPMERQMILARMVQDVRSEEHTSELQSLMRISYAVFCLKKKT